MILLKCCTCVRWVQLDDDEVEDAIQTHKTNSPEHDVIVLGYVGEGFVNPRLPLE